MKTSTRSGRGRPWRETTARRKLSFWDWVEVEIRMMKWNVSALNLLALGGSRSFRGSNSGKLRHSAVWNLHFKSLNLTSSRQLFVLMKPKVPRDSPTPQFHVSWLKWNMNRDLPARAFMRGWRAHSWAFRVSHSSRKSAKSSTHYLWSNNLSARAER